MRCVALGAAAAALTRAPAAAQYLAAVGCPVAASARRAAVTWLAGHAVALEYADAPASYAPPRADGDAQRPDGALDADDALSGGAQRARAPRSCGAQRTRRGGQNAAAGSYLGRDACTASRAQAARR